MKEIIAAFKEIERRDEDGIFKSLQNLIKSQDLEVLDALPISVVNQKSKIKSSQAECDITDEALYDEDGLAYDKYETNVLEPLLEKFPSIFQSIDRAIVDTTSMSTLVFESKRPNDYWKRLTNTDAIKAMVKMIPFDVYSCNVSTIEKEMQESSNGQWSLESDLRDDMRSKKENPLLRQKPYIVVFVPSEDMVTNPLVLKAMLEHYFVDNIVVQDGEKGYLLGYAKTLHEVSLKIFFKKRL